MNWDNLRFVLAVADHGSVNAAARLLGVTHATVLRRVAAFEAEHGGPVFDKSATGYTVRPDRLRVIDAAREMANVAQNVDRLMAGSRAPLLGLVRISSTDSMCQLVLPRLLAELRLSEPQLFFELLSSNHHVDIARQQADVTVRPALRLPDEMVGESPAPMTFRAYVRPDAPQKWLMLNGPLARSKPAEWLAVNVSREDVAGSSDSFLVLGELARQGLGIAVLPAFLGNQLPELEWRPDLMPDQITPVWVATHVDLADVSRIRIARERLVAYLADRVDLLAGNPT